MSSNRTAESLFYDVAQDNEVLQLFKHHSLRVMYLASTLAKRVSCYDENLRVAALLHDIGKVGLTKQILLKPGKLNTLERTIIETHSHVGNRIVRKELKNNRVAEFIRDHHENWNGSGYPRGLSGEDISIEGRIIRICDSFDAMTYDMRSYMITKKTITEAVQELKRCSWADFDGNLVDEFIVMLADNKIDDNWYAKMSPLAIYEQVLEIDKA